MYVIFEVTEKGENNNRKVCDREPAEYEKRLKNNMEFKY